MDMVVVETYKYMVVEVTKTEERRLVNIWRMRQWR